MASIFLNTLSVFTDEHVVLSQTRRQTFVWLVFLVMRHGTVNLWRLAAHAPSSAQVNSIRRRFYRFFQFVHIDPCMAARMTVRLLGLEGKPWTLTIDRTNWEFGKVSINILMIAVIWNGVGIPLVWTLVPGKGNSSTRVRTRLLDRLHGHFPDMKINLLIGDREFVGSRWMAYLSENNIRFILRLRENQLVTRRGYDTWPISRIAQAIKHGQSVALKGKCYLRDGPSVRIVIMRLKSGELLALACTSHPSKALASYRQRWTIETLFANLKTRGFDMEATHIKSPEKLSTLMAIVAIATALATKCGVAASRAKPIKVKSHGRKAVSLFALGLTTIQKLFVVHDNKTAHIVFGYILQNRRLTKTKLTLAFSPGV